VSGVDAPGQPLPLGEVVTDALGAALLAHAREDGEVEVVLGPGEAKLLAEMPWPLRRAEWLAGRRVAKALLQVARGLDPKRVDILPRDSGAPMVLLDGVEVKGLVLSITHTRRYAVAAVADGPVGVDACDDADGTRLPRIARRVLNPGEAERCGAHKSPQTQAAVWALKEAGLKLRIGGVFDPGAKSVCVEALDPPRVADGTMQVKLYRLPDAAVAVARESR